MYSFVFMDGCQHLGMDDVDSFSFHTDRRFGIKAIKYPVNDIAVDICCYIVQFPFIAYDVFMVACLPLKRLPVFI